MSELEFQKVLVASSGHITHEDMKNLEQMAEFFRDRREDETLFEVLDYGEGVLLYVYPPNSTEDATNKYLLETFPDWADVGVEVKALYALAHKNECAYLKLDRDGPEIEGMELFEW